MKREINLYIYVFFPFICIFDCVFYSFTLKLMRYVAFEWIKRRYIWDKVFKNGPREICGWHPLKNLNWYDTPKQTIRYEIFLKAVFHIFYLVHYWMPWFISKTAIITFGLLRRNGDVVEPEMKGTAKIVITKLPSVISHHSKARVDVSWKVMMNELSIVM